MAEFEVCIKPDDLIAQVEANPCLWDNTCEQYKVKQVKREAWTSICKALVPEYKNLSEEQKQATVHIVKRKWIHIRDYFQKSLRNGSVLKKKGKYFDQMLFLVPVLGGELEPVQIEYIEEEIGDTSNSDITEEPEPPESHRPEPAVPATRRKKTSVRPLRRSESPTQRKPRVTKDLPVDPDLAFCHSILPGVRKFGESRAMKRIRERDKLDFRIEVMQLLKKYDTRDEEHFYSQTSTAMLPTRTIKSDHNISED